MQQRQPSSGPGPGSGRSVPGHNPNPPGSDLVIQIPADLAVQPIMTIVIRTLLITIKRIRIHPAAGIPVIFLIRRQCMGQVQFSRTEGIIPHGRIRTGRQGPAQEALDLTLIPATAILSVLQVPGRGFRIIRAAGVPAAFRGAAALPAPVIPVAFPGWIIPTQGRLLVFLNRSRRRLKGSRNFIGQVPVLRQDRLQAGYAGLVNFNREGREEFLGSRGRSPLMAKNIFCKRLLPSHISAAYKLVSAR